MSIINYIFNSTFYYLIILKSIYNFCYVEMTRDSYVL